MCTSYVHTFRSITCAIAVTLMIHNTSSLAILYTTQAVASDSPPPPSAWLVLTRHCHYVNHAHVSEENDKKVSDIRVDFENRETVRRAGDEDRVSVFLLVCLYPNSGNALLFRVA